MGHELCVPARWTNLGLLSASLSILNKLTIACKKVSWLEIVSTTQRMAGDGGIDFLTHTVSS